MEFKFPANVKQMGDVDEEFKVYVEDYAYTYICQYAKTEAYSEKVAALLGKYIEADGERILMISGVIQGKFSENIGGGLIFTDETWQYIEVGKERYFKELEIVGWLHAKAGNGDKLLLEDIQFHEEYFEEKHKVLFVLDVLEKVETFFVWNVEENGLRELNGYFIYYDKNDGMQDYMLDNKLVKSRSYNYKEEEEDEEKEDVIVSYKKQERLRKEEQSQKKIVNMLVGSSAVIVSLCFVMGLLLMQNSKKIDSLEKQLVKVNENYKELSQWTVPVFASLEAQKESEENNIEKETSSEIKEEVTQASMEVEESTIQEMQTEEFEENSSEEKTTVAEEETEEVTQESTEAESELKSQTQEIEKITQITQNIQKEIPDTYIVQPGDTLSEISTYFYGTKKYVQAIMECNNIKNADKVYVGMTLKLPE